MNYATQARYYFRGILKYCNVPIVATVSIKAVSIKGLECAPSALGWANESDLQLDIGTYCDVPDKSDNNK